MVSRSIKDGLVGPGLIMARDSDRVVLWENAPGLLGRGYHGMYARYTVGRIIPWWVARPQSPPPFHPGGGYSEVTEAKQERGVSRGPAQEDWTGE